MRKLFGTDGVRGVANLEPMTSETAMQLAVRPHTSSCAEQVGIKL